MSGRPRAGGADAATSRRLFIASCTALIATAMSFAIRGDIMGDFERLFALTKTDVGWISGAAFWGFGLSILLGGPLCDLVGMGKLLRFAAVGHIGGALLLAIIGATGAFSTAIAGPVMGWINDHYGANRVLSIWAVLPAALAVIFTGIYLADRLRGGYRVERIGGKMGG